MTSASIVVELSRPEKRRLVRWVRKARDAGERVRGTIILHYASGWTTSAIAEAVRYDPSAVRKVRRRFLEHGDTALIDQRRDNGTVKADLDVLTALTLLVNRRPSAYGWCRSTWSLELFARTLEQQTGVSVSPSTVARMLKRLGIRQAMARPYVKCPWPPEKRDQRLREIADLLDSMPSDEVVFYEDEVDIHLNPRIGRQWALPRRQPRVLTPGKNQKAYVAGAVNAQTGELHWVTGERKDTDLFLELLGLLHRRHPHAKRIHLVLDNYNVHYAKRVQRMIDEYADGRIELHFLPPFCPEHNPIERLWKSLHGRVTRNHACRSLRALLANTERFLNEASPWMGGCTHPRPNALWAEAA